VFSSTARRDSKSQDRGREKEKNKGSSPTTLPLSGGDYSSLSPPSGWGKKEERKRGGSSLSFFLYPFTFPARNFTVWRTIRQEEKRREGGGKKEVVSFSRVFSHVDLEVDTVHLANGDQCVREKREKENRDIASQRVFHV